MLKKEEKMKWHSKTECKQNPKKRNAARKEAAAERTGEKRQDWGAKFSMQGELQWVGESECLNKCCDSYTAHAEYRTTPVYHRTGLAGHQQLRIAM